MEQQTFPLLLKSFTPFITFTVSAITGQKSLRLQQRTAILRTLSALRALLTQAKEGRRKV